MMFDVQEMLDKSRAKDSGVQLEVNERFVSVDVACPQLCTTQIGVFLRILDSCTELMRVCAISYMCCCTCDCCVSSEYTCSDRTFQRLAEGDCRRWQSMVLQSCIQVCIADSTVCQGGSSAKDFYKRNHRWTEGLISAAKAVGWGASVLVYGLMNTLVGVICWSLLVAIVVLVIQQTKFYKDLENSKN